MKNKHNDKGEGQPFMAVPSTELFAPWVAPFRYLGESVVDARGNPMLRVNHWTTDKSQAIGDRVSQLLNDDCANAGTDR